MNRDEFNDLVAQNKKLAIVSAVLGVVLIGLVITLVMLNKGGNTTGGGTEQKAGQNIIVAPVSDDTTASTVSSEAAATPTEAPTATPTPTPEPEPATETVYPTVDNLNVRPTAGTDGDPLGQVNIGDALTKTGEEGEWTKIDYNGQTGYVKTEFLSTTAP